jgi:uncharacterized protein
MSLKYLTRPPKLTQGKKLANMIDEELLTAMEGVIPSPFSTVSDEGVPNVSYVSQVFYVDENHVAISNQFFNKSLKNVYSNGKATINITRPSDFKAWYLKLKHVETHSEGELFDKMKMQLEAIASMIGMEDVFHLNAAEVFKVILIEDAQFT